MPVYEYRCNDCHAVFDVLRPMAERELTAVCPGCESRASMPLISRVAAGGREWTSSGSAAGESFSGGGCCGGGCGCGN